MHHIFDVEDSGFLNAHIMTELKKQGIKETGRCRKPTRNNNNDLGKKNLFGQPLELLESEETLIMVESELPDERKPDGKAVTAKGDILVRVPTFVTQSCQAILKGVQTEGLFRKAGSAARQREIKRQLERGEGVKPAHDVIDLANILKQFLRELPEPLIPYQLHEMLLKCIQLDASDKVFQAIHLVCLLIPPRPLATLCYLLQFFEAVAANSQRNLMDAGNLSIVMAPTLIPVHIGSTSTRTDRRNSGCSKLQHSAKVVQILIENGTKLCGLPRCISSRLVSSISTVSLTDQLHLLAGNDPRGRRCSRDKKQRHRRSSSFNRVFEGLRKIVGVRTDWSASVEQLSDLPSESLAAIAEPAPALQPTVSPIVRSTLKRKVDNEGGSVPLGLSMKKKKSVVEGLRPAPSTGKVLCTTPLTPQGHHRYGAMHSEAPAHSYFASPRIDLNPSPSGPSANAETNKSAVGVLRFFHRTKKGLGRNEETNGTVRLTPAKAAKRRLSLVKKTSKKLLALDHPKDVPEEVVKVVSPPPPPPLPSSPPPKTPQSTPMEEEVYDAVRQHYDVIKSQVAALEKELKPVVRMTPSLPISLRPVVSPPAPLESVQGAYERTLEESEKLLLERSASEQLARQMSRGLRIRRSAEQKVMRSPSARKIGAVRRRSRESSPRRSLNDSNASCSSRRLTRSQSMLAIRRNPSCLRAIVAQQPQQMLVTPKRPLLAGSPFLPDSGVKVSLRRGQPNTIRTGLRDPTPMRVQSAARTSPAQVEVLETPRAPKPRILAYPAPEEGETPKPEPSSTERTPRSSKRPIHRKASIAADRHHSTRSPAEVKSVAPAAQLPATPAKPVVPTTPEGQGINSNMEWVSGEVLLANKQLDHLRIPLTGRPSVQKIRSENMGKVSAHVRKFDRLASPSSLAAKVDQVDGGQLTPHRPIAASVSTSHVATHRRLSTNETEVSPLRESHRANAGMAASSSARPANTDRLRSDLKIKAPLLTPSAAASAATATPFNLRLAASATAGRHHVRVQKKPSPMRAGHHHRSSPKSVAMVTSSASSGLRRSPRFITASSPHN